MKSTSGLNCIAGYSRRKSASEGLIEWNRWNTFKMIASATAASAAARMITKMANIWPSMVVAAEAREGHEVDVGGVEDHLDAHQHVQHVAPDDDAHQPQREQRRGDGDVGSQTHYGLPPMAPVRAPSRLGSMSARLRLAM